MLNEQSSIIFSELLVNLAAGWFSIVLIGPVLSKISSLLDIILLLGNVFAGIICLFFAYKFRILYE